MNDEDLKKLEAAVFLKTIVLSIKDAIKYNEEIKKLVIGFNNVFQWKILPDGPSINLSVDDETVSGTEEKQKKPDIVFKFSDVDVYLKTMWGKLNPEEAVMRGKISIDGNLSKAVKMGMVMVKMRPYALEIREKLK